MKTSGTAPKAEKHPLKLVKHGDVRIDNYFWLKDKKNPKTISYLNAENEYFEQQLKPLSRLKNKIYDELKSRVPANDHSVPFVKGEYEYFYKLKKGLQYKTHYRRKVGSGKDEVVLDENLLAKNKKYFELGEDVVSPNQKTVAYTTDVNGSEKYTIHFRDIKAQKILTDKIADCSGSLVWSEDSLFVFYIAVDKDLKPYRLYRHELGTPNRKDVLLYEEKDARYFLSVHASSSKKYIFLFSGSKEASEVHYLEAAKPSQKFKCFKKRQEGIIYSVDHRNQEFWIHTNEKAKNHQILTCSEFEIARNKWRPFLKNSTTTYKSGMQLFANHLVIVERFNGLPQIRIYNFLTKKFHVVQFPDVVYSLGLGANFEFDSTVLRLSYSSPIWPQSVLDYDMNSKIFTVKKELRVPKYNKKNYKCERVWVKAHDGVRVPLMILYKRGVRSKAPCYLEGYGSYGYSFPSSFDRDILSLVDRGFVYAVAHIRGGGEMGRHWYDNGKFLKKKNTFKDFISCAEFLIKTKRAEKSKLFICGRSAGGMLMGACLNMRPDLFNTVIAHVPFVDVLNTMLDDTLMLTKMEYDEWGNPNNKKFYKYMKSYSPYDNMANGDYPAVFITCGLNDPRVTYWEPAKWVAKMRELRTNSEPILFKTHMGAGHFGNTGRYEMLRETAEEYAFVLARAKGPAPLGSK